MAVSESNMADFRHCHLGFSHLVIFSQINSRNILPPLWLWLKLIQYHSNSFILTQLDDGSHLEFCHLWFNHFAQKRTSLNHSDSTWWWQPSWNLPSWIQTLPSWIQTPCHLLSDTLKNILSPLWLWHKLIQSDSNSFILTQPDDGSHLEFCYLAFNHFAQKKLHLFILTQLDDGSHLEICHVGFRMAAIIKLSQNEWVKFIFVQIVGTNLGKCEWVWEGKLRWMNANWQNSRMLPSSSWVTLNEFESDWISLSQSQSGESVFECLREENKVFESKMAEFKMVAIIKWSQNESVKFFLCKWWDPILASVSEFERK